MSQITMLCLSASLSGATSLRVPTDGPPTSKSYAAPSVRHVRFTADSGQRTDFAARREGSSLTEWRLSWDFRFTPKSDHNAAPH